MASHLSQVTGHLTDRYGRGLLSGDVAIITGAGQGIGKATGLLLRKRVRRLSPASKFRAPDKNVTFLNEAQYRPKRLDEVVTEIKSVGGDVIGISGDVGADDFPKKIVDVTIKTYGKINHIIKMVNDLFMIPSPQADTIIQLGSHTIIRYKMPGDAFDIVKVHLRAPFRLIRQAAPYFRIKDMDGENRSIINVSSTSGLHGSVGRANYAAAKSAVNWLDKDNRKRVGSIWHSG
ncbi:hypothetical protein APHAL10511_008224 [Amanita phalloides]|nr:hypothetical protein APHAL10511_008224 [Amanita phalloides]